MSMKFERDERKFDFHDIGCEIKRKRETSGMTQDQLAFIIDRDPRTIIYNENDGQHPSLNTFYQMVTMFDISVDQFFYPDMSADDASAMFADLLSQISWFRLPLFQHTIGLPGWQRLSSSTRRKDASPHRGSLPYSRSLPRPDDNRLPGDSP